MWLFLLIQLGIEPPGLKDWIEEYNCRRTETAEVLAADGDEAEVYIHLDDDNPILKNSRDRNADDVH